MARLGRARAARVVVVPAQQVERVGAAACGCRRSAPGIHAALSTKNGMPVSWNSPLVNAGPKWQALQLPLPTKMRKPALRRVRIARHRGAVAACQRIAELVERRAPAHQRLLERGERLADVREHRLVAGGRRRAEHLLVAAGELRVGAHQRRRLRRAPAHLARVEDRPDALRPQAVVGAVPAEPAPVAHVEQARRVAVDLGEAEGARAAVLPGAERHVAGRAQHLAGRRQPRLEEQALAQLDRLRVARGAVARDRAPRAAARGRGAGWRAFRRR